MSIIVTVLMVSSLACSLIVLLLTEADERKWKAAQGQTLDEARKRWEQATLVSKLASLKERGAR